MKNEIPNQSYRTFAAALILAVVVFTFSGLILHYICPEKEKVQKTMNVSPYAIFDR